MDGTTARKGGGPVRLSGVEWEPVNGVRDEFWGAFALSLTFAAPQSSTENNQLRTGADKGNPTV